MLSRREFVKLRKEVLDSVEGQALFLSKPTTRQQLHDFIELFMHYDIIMEPVCEEHNSQMDYLWHSYNDKGDCVYLGCRGSGKTATGGIGTIVDSMFKPGFQTRIIGGCLTPDSILCTAGGFKNIIDVKENEYVLGRSGLNRVKKLTTRFYRGSLCYITPFRGTKIGITPDHLVWAVESIKCYKTMYPCRPTCSTYESCPRRCNTFKPEWTKASRLDPGTHWLLYPSEISKLAIDPSALGVQDPISDSMEFFGFYLGSKVDIDRGCIKIPFICHEKDKQREGLWKKMLHKIAKNISDKQPYYTDKIINTSNGERLSLIARISIGKMRNILESMGSKWKSRSINPMMLAVDKFRTKRLLKGFILSSSNDNGRGDTRVRITVANKRLAGQLYLIFLKSGIVPMVESPRPMANDSYWRLRFSKTEMAKLYKSLGLHMLKPIKTKECKLKDEYTRTTFFHNNWSWTAIRKVEIDQFFEGDVYNLEMENDPSYCTPGMTVHNSLAQSERMYEHTNVWQEDGFAELKAESFKKYTELANGSRFEILTQSTKSSRGHHVEKLKCDEADEFKPSVWKSLHFCTQSSEEHASSFEILSTAHVSGGIMSDAIRKAEEIGNPVFRVCVLEILEPCRRKCKNKDGSFCPLWDDCKGIAKKKKSGYLKIDDAIKMKQRSDLESWDVEMMLKKPDTSAMVYPTWNEKVNVVPDIPFNPGWDTYRAFDFGTTDPFVVLYLQESPDETLWLIDSLYLEQLAPSLAVAEIVDFEGENRVPDPMLSFCDPSGADYRKELMLRGISTVGISSKKVEGVMAVRERLKKDNNGNPLFRVCARNERFIREISGYSKDKFLRGGPDDHGPDALRYYCVNKRHSGGSLLLPSSNSLRSPLAVYQVRKPARRIYNPSEAFQSLIESAHRQDGAKHAKENRKSSKYEKGS